MAPSNYAQSYGEPWVARPQPQSEHVQTVSGEDELSPPIDPKFLPWHVWANVSDAGMAKGLMSGQTILVSEAWPIITFRKSHAVTLQGVTQQTLARRVADCVSFCAGVDLLSLEFDDLKSCLEAARLAVIQASRSQQEETEEAPPTREDFNELWPLRLEK